MDFTLIQSQTSLTIGLVKKFYLKLRTFFLTFSKENFEKNGFLLETSEIFPNFWYGKFKKFFSQFYKAPKHALNAQQISALSAE